MQRRQGQIPYRKPWSIATLVFVVVTILMITLTMMMMNFELVNGAPSHSHSHSEAHTRKEAKGPSNPYQHPALSFPDTFHLTFIARERSSKEDEQKEQYQGTISREANGEISAVVTATNVQFADLNPLDESDAKLLNGGDQSWRQETDKRKTKQNTFLYRNGQMMLNGDCVPDMRNVPPAIPDFDKHLLDNAVPLAITDYPLTYDREINLCITKSWYPWVVTYHGEPFVVCIDHIEASGQLKNRISFVPKRIIGSTTVIDIIDYRPNESSQDIMKLTENALLGESAGVCRKAMLEMRENGQTNRSAMTNIVSESILSTKSNDHGSTYPGTLLHRTKRAYGLSRLAMVHQERSNKKNGNIDESVLRARKIHHDDLRLFWFYDFALSCQRDWIRDDNVCQMVSQSNDEPSKTCIFLHGVGQAEEDKGEPVSEFPDYWGDVQDFTPQCKERIFIREETKKRGWDSIELQKSYCDLALSGQAKGDNVIRNKILYVHSMGNLILAGAIKNKICDVDSKTTTWYNIQGPFNGSKAASTLKEICLAVGAGWTEPVPALYYYIASKGGYCIPETNRTFEAYQTLEPTYPGLSELYPAVADKINGFLCGDSPFGLYSMYSPLLGILAQFVNYGEPSDGMVAIRSCNPGNIDQNPDHRQPQYLGSLNHADGTCRNGDGRWGDHRKPCSYFTGRE